MRYAPKILLHTPTTNAVALAPFVGQCLTDHASIIASFGHGARDIEDLIDEIVVGDGSDLSRVLMTSAHEDETVEEVSQFLEAWDGDRQEVRF